MINLAKDKEMDVSYLYDIKIMFALLPQVYVGDIAYITTMGRRLLYRVVDVDGWVVMFRRVDG